MMCLVCQRKIYTDDVVSTDCGHVMHVSCFRTWRKSSAECPECKINLLKNKTPIEWVKPSELNIHENLQVCTETAKIDFKESGRDSSSVHVENHKLNEEHDRVGQGTVSLNTQKRMAELERENARLCAENETLCTQKRQLIEYFNRKVNLLEKKANDNSLEQMQKECSQLRETLKFELRQKDALEGKLKDIKMSLQKEKRHSAELFEAKIKLETILKRTAASGAVTENKGINLEEGAQNIYKNKGLNGIASPREIVLNIAQHMSQRLEQIRLELQKEKGHSKKLLMDEIKLDSKTNLNTVSSGVMKNKKDTNQKLARNSADERKVEQKKAAGSKPIRNGLILKGFRGIGSPLETVLKVAQQIKVDVGEDDIEDIVVNRHAKDVSLTVAFKTKTLQDLFMDNWKKVKNIPDMRHTEVCYYSAINDLLAYAKQLKSVGFEYVAIHKNCVNVRRDSNSQYIKIFNKGTVDEMMKLTANSDAKQVNALKPEQPPQKSNSATKKPPLTPACSKDSKTRGKYELPSMLPSDNSNTPNVNKEGKTSNNPAINPNAHLRGVWTPNPAALTFQPQFPVPNFHKQPLKMAGVYIPRPGAPATENRFPAPRGNQNTSGVHSQGKQAFQMARPHGTRPAIPATEHRFAAPRGNQNTTGVYNHEKQAFQMAGPHGPRPAPPATKNNFAVPCDNPNPPKTQWRNPFKTYETSAPQPMAPGGTSSQNGILGLPSASERNHPNSKKMVKPTTSFNDCDDEFYAP